MQKKNLWNQTKSMRKSKQKDYNGIFLFSYKFYRGELYLTRNIDEQKLSYHSSIQI